MAVKKNDHIKKDRIPQPGKITPAERKDSTFIKQKSAVIPVKKDGGGTQSTGPRRKNKK